MKRVDKLYQWIENLDQERTYPSGPIKSIHVNFNCVFFISTLSPPCYALISECNPFFICFFFLQFFIGGVPNFEDSLSVRQNFTGCMENIYFNATNFIRTMKEAYESGDDWEMNLYRKNNILFSCPVRTNSFFFLTYNHWSQS